jgi:hypothetical protein
MEPTKCSTLSAVRVVWSENVPDAGASLYVDIHDPVQSPDQVFPLMRPLKSMAPYGPLPCPSLSIW